MGAACPEGQLAAAFVTALTHEDAATRARADERVRRWRQVLSGMAVPAGGRRLLLGWTTGGHWLREPEPNSA